MLDVEVKIMGHYLTYVLVPEGNIDLSRPLDEFMKFDEGSFNPNAAGGVQIKGIPVETKVELLMAPYGQDHRVGEYRRECDCVIDSALKKIKTLPGWRVDKVLCEFTKDEFSKPGIELEWRRNMLELGSPDPECEECQGSGILVSHDNPSTKWDWWDIGTGFAENILKDCVIGEREDLNIVPVQALDLDKIPTPNHILTPDGKWISDVQFLWSSSVVVEDEHWEDTFRTVLNDHADSTLVVVNVHY